MDKLTKILTNQYKIALKANDDNLIPYMDTDNVKNWYFLIKGLDAPYKDGEYIFKLTVTDQFPHAPPKFEFCTPNGVYDIGGPICISVGEFHTNDKPGKDGSHGWRPSLGMYGFARQVLNGLICYEGLEHGIRILNTSIEIKEDFTSKSKEYNTKNYSLIIWA